VQYFLAAWHCRRGIGNCFRDGERNSREAREERMMWVYSNDGWSSTEEKWLARQSRGRVATLQLALNVIHLHITSQAGITGSSIISLALAIFICFHTSPLTTKTLISVIKPILVKYLFESLGIVTRPR